MAVQQARVPVLDAGGRFPDAYAPASVAANTAAAQEAREGAETARTGAVTAQGKAEDAQRGAENALAGVPGAVEGALAPQVKAATDAAEAAHDSSEAAQGSAEAAAQTADSRIAAGLASGGVIKAADDATLSAAKSYADSGVAQLNRWFLRGSGSPLGVVTPASAGVQYVDTAQTRGARVWISTGTGSTSWKVVDGNTGMRILEPVVPLQQGRFVIQRINDTIILYVVDVRVFLEQASKDTRVLNIPPLFDVTQKFVSGFSMTAPYFWRGDILKEEGVGQYLNFGAESTARGYCRDTCVLQALNSQWPTTLPGTPG